MKNKIIIISTIILVLLCIIGINLTKEEKYTYQWIEEKDSSIGQYRLYINDSKGNHINGTARIVYVNGKTKRVDISKKVNLYVKSVISEVRNVDKR